MGIKQYILIPYREYKSLQCNDLNDFHYLSIPRSLTLTPHFYSCIVACEALYGRSGVELMMPIVVASCEHDKNRIFSALRLRSRGALPEAVGATPPEVFFFTPLCLFLPSSCFMLLVVNARIESFADAQSTHISSGESLGQSADMSRSFSSGSAHAGISG